MTTLEEATTAPDRGPFIRLRRDTWFWVILVVALILRVGAVLLLAHTPNGLPDPTSYWIAGQSIAVGDGYRSIIGELMAHYPPGYPYFLGAVFWAVNLLGAQAHAATIVGLVQAILGTATVAAVMIAAKTWAGRGVALVAGLLLALWPSQVLYPAAILSETLYLFLFGVFLVALVRACRTPDRAWPWIAVAAVFAGASTIVRPQGIALSLPLLVMAWLLSGLDWRRALGWTAAIALGVVVVVAPWTYRNAQVYGAFVPSRRTRGPTCASGSSRRRPAISVSRRTA